MCKFSHNKHLRQIKLTRPKRKPSSTLLPAFSPTASEKGLLERRKAQPDDLLQRVPRLSLTITGISVKSSLLSRNKRPASFDCVLKGIVRRAQNAQPDDLLQRVLSVSLTITSTSVRSSLLRRNVSRQVLCFQGSLQMRPKRDCQKTSKRSWMVCCKGFQV